jgi:hypothetical protein
MLISTGSGHLIAANQADQDKLLKLRPDGNVGLSKVFLVFTVRLAIT